MSLGLNMKSKLQTRGYKTTGVGGGEWVASHGGGGTKQVHLYAPPLLRGTGLTRMVKAMKEAVHALSWSPVRNLGAQGTHSSVNIWPSMTGPLGCVRVFTAPKSIIVGRVVKDAYKRTRVRNHMIDYTPATLPTLRRADSIIYERDIHIWMDGSAKDNGTDICTAGSAWVSDLQFEDKVSLKGSVLSNNIAEVAAVVLCLMAWRDAHIVIHTDSTFVLGLLKGGLLAMERDGWGNAPRHLSRGPPTPLLQQLLYLLWDRTGRVRFVKAKAHGDDNMNNMADALANEGRLKGRVFDICSLTVPAGWVDTALVLCHQPLDYMTKLVVRARLNAPAKTIKFESFSDRWTVTLGNMFGVVLDPGNYIGKVWTLPVPEGLKEVLWKEMNGAQVLGHRYFGRGHVKSDMGRVCPCSAEMSLGHILVGCGAYRLCPLMEILLKSLEAVHPGLSFKTLTPDAWGSSPWYPILAIGELEEHTYPFVKGRKAILEKLKKTRQWRVWIIGNYYWAIWKWRMKEIHDAGFSFLPAFCMAQMRETLLMPVPSHLLTQQEAKCENAATLGTTTKAAGKVTQQRHGDDETLRGAADARLNTQNEHILRALRAPATGQTALSMSRWDAILWALTDGAYV